MWRSEIERIGLDAGDEGAPYDRKAATYDRLVRSRTYNRVLWGASPADYEAFALRALDAGAGPLLDVAGGSAAATAHLYAHASREVVLVDRSRAMLGRAQARIARACGPLELTPHVRLVQADALRLAWVPHRFETVLCMGLMHIVADPEALLRALCEQAQPTGKVYFTSLVADRGVGAAYLRLLHRAGEVAAPRTSAELSAALGGLELEVRGNMAYGVATNSG
ncbi:MAG: methyltransferase domain-containing protein [Solirubrobacteraceae bacterium]|nr:methyltransferase domain-containing protein [Solirubrobacteraceae bacterium]